MLNRKNVHYEIELYEPMRNWLHYYLQNKYKEYSVITLDSHAERLDRVLAKYGICIDLAVGVDIQIDVLGIVKKRQNVYLFFIEAKKTPLNTHDLGQILVYSRICNPEKAFLFSSAGTGSLEKLIRQREDLTLYSPDKRLKMIQIAKWDVARNMPDVTSMIPKTV